MTITKHIATSLVLLAVALFSAPALATQPCVGSSNTCSWTCTQDGGGNIVSYSVSCGYTDWCVSSDGNVGVGLCDIAPPPGDDPVAAVMLELEVLDDEVGGGTCDAPPPKLPPAKLPPAK